MNSKLTDRLVATLVFAYALVVYLLTVAPTTSFWDAGEFIAIAHGLQVSHPPGAPFYMLVGRLFSMFVPAESVALSVNLVSVFASAFTVLLAHLIIVRLIAAWQGAPATWTPMGRLTALAGGVVGSLTFAVTDSFWFNAVEAEVYALSMLFTAAVIWLIMRWRDQAIQEEAALAGGQHPFGLSANRYLVLIAYLFGLAIGVHLLNLLALFFISLIVFFQEFERPDWTPGKRWTAILITALSSAAIFLVIYPGIVQVLPDLAGQSGAPILFVLATIAAVVAAVYYTHTRGMGGANLLAVSLAAVLIGYSTYALIFIRSAADPPIDENDPETTEAIVSYLKREQYGQTPLLKGLTFNNRTGAFDRETLFPRRHSAQPVHARLYAQYDSDWEFFWKYQVGHMYLRYFLFNFVGRASDAQDAPAITGLLPDEARDYTYLTPSERASRNAYFALPLLLGLIGAVFHFSRDWKRAFSVLVLFLVTGIGIIIYLNQPPFQPRERDYSYVASFFAFSLWIGIGATGILQLIHEKLRGRSSDEDDERRENPSASPVQVAVLTSVALVIFLAVPVWMFVENYFDHDRSGQYVAPDYAHNMLLSVDENAVLFTNGDNDTFPLWYLQEVEGFRRDVRVANLSLLNTSWYIRQLKNQWSRESPPLPISLPDDEIDRLGVSGWQPQEVSLPVDVEALAAQPALEVVLQEDVAVQSPMTWTLNGRPYSEQFNMLFVADQVVFDMLQTNARQQWERPIYFAITVSRDGQLDLQNYFQLEGQAFRVVPIRHEEALGRVVPGITDANLMRFRFTNVNNPDVYFDENIRRMVDNYRNVFSHTADRLAAVGRPQEAEALLDKIMHEVPFETVSGDERSHYWLARGYEAAGNREKAAEVWHTAEPLVLHRLERATSDRDVDMALQYVQLIRSSYANADKFERASEFTSKIAAVVGDDSILRTPQELREEYETEVGAAEEDTAP